jgi:hypothetical protein
MEAPKCLITECTAEHVRRYACQACKKEYLFCQNHNPFSLPACDCSKNPKKKYNGPVYRAGCEPPPKSTRQPEPAKIRTNADKIEAKTKPGQASSSSNQTCSPARSDTDVCPSCRRKVDDVITDAALRSLQKQKLYVPGPDSTVTPSENLLEAEKRKMKSSVAHTIIGQTQIRDLTREILKIYLQGAHEIVYTHIWLAGAEWDKFVPFYVAKMMEGCRRIPPQQIALEHYVPDHLRTFQADELKREKAELAKKWKTAKSPSNFECSQMTSLCEMVETAISVKRESSIKHISSSRIYIQGECFSPGSMGLKGDAVPLIRLKIEKSMVVVYKDAKVLKEMKADPGDNVKIKIHKHAQDTSPAEFTFHLTDAPVKAIGGDEPDSDEESADDQTNPDRSAGDRRAKSWVDSVFSEITKTPFSQGKQCHYCEELQADYNVIQRFEFYLSNGRSNPEIVGCRLLDELDGWHVENFVEMWLLLEIAPELRKNIQTITRDLKL